jgi:tripartite-type tricarboxylate transporter receptor subunit TctC
MAMNLSRRRLLKLATAAAARPVRILVGFAAGGGYDIAARLIGQWLSERLGRPFIIENRPGAATNIATEAAVNAPADGYTLLMVGIPNASNASLYTNLKFNFLHDVAPVAGLLREPFIVETNLAVPVRTMREFISYAEASPGKINMASAGVGSGNHLAGALFQMMTGIKLAHVPYRGASLALADLLGGEVQVMFASTSSSIAYVRAGKLRPLAVTTVARSAMLPDTPTVAESLPGYEFSFWNGLGVRSGTPPEIIERLNKQINTALADPEFKERLAKLGGAPLTGSPADFGKLIAGETEKWRKVILAANIKPE